MFSVLYPSAKPPANEPVEAPEYFRDLNLDQILDAVAAEREAYDLAPFLRDPLRDSDAIAYRHEVLRDLERDDTLAHVEAFSQAMRSVRERLARAEKAHYDRQRERWFLDAAISYCAAISALSQALRADALTSRGLVGFRDYVNAYAATAAFRTLADRAHAIEGALAKVAYGLVLTGDEITVRAYEGEPDYSVDVERTFERFKQGSVKSYIVEFPPTPEANHVEARILDYVSALFPQQFAELADFRTAYARFTDETIERFDREVQLYAAYLAYIAPLRDAGLQFCYPAVCTIDKNERNDGVFDLALAHKLAADGSHVVTNDYALNDPERILVVTGPNQGGKTTFARMFGQLHYLARLGLLVPGSTAKLFLCDAIFTHFEREEDPSALRGKLEDDLFRIRDILAKATSRSVVITNEIFSSTTPQDAVGLGKRILDEIVKLDALCVWVTFLDELASLGPTIVSMVSTVAVDDPTKRTYKVVRRPADGRSYALSIAEKYGLTYERIRKRVVR